MTKLCEGSPESVQTTVRELEENLKEGITAAGGSSKTNLARAKVIGIACDVCNPDDVQKLANFAVNKLGSIDIWVRVWLDTCQLSLISCCYLLGYLLKFSLAAIPNFIFRICHPIVARFQCFLRIISECFLPYVVCKLEKKKEKKSAASDIFYLINYTLGQINNAGTNKGFRPLLQFNDEDITQVFIMSTSTLCIYFLVTSCLNVAIFVKKHNYKSRD